MIDLSARDKLATTQRAAFEDDFILEHWPLSSAACQIRRERSAAQVWSTPAQRSEWKAEAEQQIAALAEDMLAAYNAEAEARKDRMGADYWDRRLDKEQHAPVAGVPRNRGLSGI